MTVPARIVWFHRQYERLTGGHVKHAHYYDHVARLAGHERRIAFGGPPPDERLDRERTALWPTDPSERVDEWQPGGRDILFLAGTDWRFHAKAGLDGIDIPRINLVQHTRHGHAGTELHGYLDRRAVRICVSADVAAAIRATGRVNGPVFTIPNGTERRAAEIGCGGSLGFDDRPEGVAIVGYKRPDLARRLSRGLAEQGIGHLMLDRFVDREAFLGVLARSRVAVCLPRAEEGFYLPALEAMASGCTVVTLDCVGNRGFCMHEGNCLVAEPDPESLLRAVARATGLTGAERHRLHVHAARTVCAHSLEAERERFHDLLRDIDRLWTHASAPTAPAGRAEPRPADARVVDFVIVGAQKAGTSALAHFLSQHPAIAMASRECHIFDAPDYSSDWTPAQIDARYARRVEGRADAALGGESTPVYLLMPDVPRELYRYNPNLLVIVMLRDPVERAVSHFAMERARGNEHRPLWWALLSERWRLRRCPNPRGPASALRRHTYRTRSLYSRQLRNLFAVFPRRQVLVLRSENLLREHDDTLAKVFAFLGVSGSVRVPPEIVFKGVDHGGKHALMRWLLRFSLFAESRRLRTVLEAHGEDRA